MIYIDNNIRLAISSMKQICVTNDATGERLGISGKHVSQIIKGEVESIRPSTWKTMEPKLRRFLNRSIADAKQELTVNEEPTPYRTRNPELRELFQWLENDACADQIKTVISAARVVGFQSTAKNNSPSGQVESPSDAKVA